MATTTSGPSRISQRTDPTTPEPPPAPAARPGRWPKTALYVLAIIGVLVAAGYGSTRLLGSFGSSTGPVLSTYTVTRGELLITVTEDGNVESARNEDIKCQVAGGSAILSLVEDGQIVKKGDKLVELDASSLVDQINTQKIAFNKARSSVIQAEKNYQVAQISVKEYIEGTFVMQLEDSDALITIAEENLRSSQNSLQYAERMFQRGYISQLELESRQFAVKRSQLELNSSKTAKSVLVDFTKIKTMEDLKSQVETAKATMESERAAFELEEGKLKRLETQLANCTIIAPQDGMVVYANERGRFGEQGSAVEEGASVRDRQTILRLPDLNHMQVKVKVHETKVEDLRYGMRARINVQGRELRGVVTSVANQPESTTWFQGNIKEYATIVEIEGQPGGLRPGMTAEVEILVSHLNDALTLPVSAVVELRGEFFCWIKKPQMPPERQPLVLGPSNDQFVEVREGLAEGDQVIRNPRAVIADARSDDVVVEQVDVTKKFGDAQRGAAGSADGDGGAPAAPGGPAAGTRPGGPGRQGGGGQGGGGLGASFDLNQFDTDGDGKVSKDEAPGPMKSFFDRIDEDGDGFLDENEAEALQKRLRSGGSRRGGGSREPPGDTPGSQGETRENEEGARESRE